MTDRLKIGAFAALAGVSVKTLRFYADENLLAPAHVDPRSGYRFYTDAQIADVNRLLNLRAAGVGLADIRALNSQTSGVDRALLALLHRQRISLQKERAIVEGRIAIVDRMLTSIGEEGEGAVSAIRLMTIEPEFVFSHRERVSSGAGEITAMFEDAERQVAAANARALRPPFMIIHDVRRPDADEQDIEICVPVRDDAVDALPTALVSGAATACSVSFRGGYEKMPAFRKKLNDWLLSAGVKPSGPLREVYLRFGAGLEGYDLPKPVLAQKKEDYVTELRLAIKAAPKP